MSAVIVAGPSEAETNAWARPGQMARLVLWKRSFSRQRSGFAEGDRGSCTPGMGKSHGDDAPIARYAELACFGDGGLCPDLNELSWDAVSGAAHYNVYRYAGRHTEVPELIGSPTGTTFNDETALRGTRYYYSVTAVDANGLESSRFATRTEADGVSPFRGPASDITQVRIVPNPYQVQGGQLNDGGFNYQGQPNKLQFVNLPGKRLSTFLPLPVIS